VTRQLAVDATPLGEDHILGLRESFATAKVEEAEITWCHTLGYGSTHLSIEVEFPDGTQVTESMSLTKLLQDCAAQIIREKSA
jgi:hypothetical protein